ncbi:MAG TPA: SRPBCC family protein [Chthoniobacterales bacterium]|nr:SRPBCC family protein [Chthoniobacterales bacterium]
MQTGNSIIIQAPRETIFETAADLANWPRILPHYRYIRFLERNSQRSIVEMAAVRSGIPISWTSEFVVDRARMELRFLHLKKFTRGMKVVWTFKETPAGVLVEIMHALRFRVQALAPLAEPIIGGFFIHHVANQTLRAIKAHVEKKPEIRMSKSETISK